jgi:hypothetical protein
VWHKAEAVSTDVDMTHSEIIDALGGTTQVAKGLGIEPRVVSNWRKRGISKAGLYMIEKFARRKRYTLPDGFIPSRASA